MFLERYDVKVICNMAITQPMFANEFCYQKLDSWNGSFEWKGESWAGASYSSLIPNKAYFTKAYMPLWILI